MTCVQLILKFSVNMPEVLSRGNPGLRPSINSAGVRCVMSIGKFVGPFELHLRTFSPPQVGQRDPL